MKERWTLPHIDRERRAARLAFEAVWIAMTYDGLTKQTGMRLLRTVPARTLMAEPLLDEERGQELLAEAGDA